MELASYEERLELMRGLMLDYNIEPEHCLEVLERIREKAGHYNEETLFRKLLESYRWFTILILYQDFQNKLTTIGNDFLFGNDNSLGIGKTPIEEAKPKMFA